MEIINDFKTSVVKALAEIDPKWNKYKGLVIAGTHTPENIDKILSKIKDARDNNTPVLGICFGLQVAVIEYYRNVLNNPTANSEEIDPDSFPVVSQLPALRVGIFKVNGRLESHWHNYAVKKIIGDKLLGDKVYTDDILEEWRIGKFIGVQFHPEYESSKDRPHPLLKEFINICKQNGK